MSELRRIRRSRVSVRHVTSEQPPRPTKLTARSTVLKVERAETDTSQQIEYLDEFLSHPLAINGLILPTPFNVGRLFQIIDESNMLKQCIEAYVVNTVGTGWEVEPVLRERAINAGENAELATFIEHANSTESLKVVMSKVIHDRESVGFGFLEVIRDQGREISLLRHAPALYTRLAPKHRQEVLVEYTIQRGRRVSTIKEFIKFRRFAQICNGRTVWFKEFGDPRNMNRDTGLFEGEEGYVAGSEATEILHFKLVSNEPYGVPRWINQLPSILGSRESELVNLRYFKDNTVPPMFLTVGGGRLTAGSYRELTRTLQQNSIGADRQNRIMVLEAVGEGDTLDNKSTPVQLKVEKLTDARQSDALFKEYDSANQQKIRSSFRLPPIVLGLSNEQNYANAQVSAFVAESQVFGPARDDIDEFLNKSLINGKFGMAMATARLKGRIPSINSPESVIKTLTALNVIGAVTPRSAQMTANQILQTELPSYPKPGEEGYEDWMDKPLMMTLRAAKTHNEQAVKTEEVKEIEETGDPGFRRPENGSEGSVLK